MVECGLPKPETGVRFPSPAPLIINDLRKSAAKVQQSGVVRMIYRIKPQKPKLAKVGH